MTNERILGLSLTGIAILVLVSVERTLAQVWNQFSLPGASWGGGIVSLPVILGVAITGSALVAVLRNLRARTFLMEVTSELRKVTWPTRKESASSTVVVIVAVIFIALLLGLFDLVWAKFSNFLLYTKSS